MIILKINFPALKLPLSLCIIPKDPIFTNSGLKYKELGLKDKLPKMSEEEQLALLSSDGMLVKRPILVGDDLVLVGFREAEWTAAMDLKTNS